MGRLEALTAFTLLALAAPPAGAAELTRVPSIDEPADHLELSVGWVRTQRNGSISRELATATAGQTFQTVRDLRQLRFSEVTNALELRAATALWEDLGLTISWPYLLGRESGWKPGSGVGGAGLPDTIAGNTIRPDGTACASSCPIFSSKDTVHHAGGFGDLRIGVDWGAMSDRRDDTRPFWLVGLEVSLPTAKLYDPGAGRSMQSNVWRLPPDTYSSSSKAGLGQKVIRYDLHTALSRRVGVAEPYLRLHLTGLQKTSATPSNCDHMQDLVDAGQAIPGAVALCQADPARWGARLPWLGGFTVGSEFVFDEDRLAGRRVAFDLRLSVDYTSRARWTNELSDATGKLMATEAHLTALARLGFLYRATEYLSLLAAVSYGYTTPHDLSGEDPGGDTVKNPNFDWRVDAPGRRFRFSEATTLDVTASLMAQF